LLRYLLGLMCQLQLLPTELRAQLKLKIESDLTRSNGVHWVYTLVDIGYDYHKESTRFGSQFSMEYTNGGVRLWVRVKQ